MMDFEVARCTRHCAATGRELAESEEFYSVLVDEQGEVRRYDYAVDAWTGAPKSAIGWWKSRMPAAGAKRPQMAPSEVLLELFRSLEEADREHDKRYVMALLLVRRRIFRLEETSHDDLGHDVLVMYCARDESTHRVPVVMPTDERIKVIQEELNLLLFAGAA